jgi:hypothetical protein
MSNYVFKLYDTPQNKLDMIGLAKYFFKSKTEVSDGSLIEF